MRKYLCLALILCLFLTGCAAGGDLTALPRTEAGRQLLSKHMFSLLTGRAAYIIPDAGDMTCPVLDIDLDGDGADETVACLLRRSGGREYPCVEIYTYPEGHPELAGAIRGEGDCIPALRFPVLDDAGTIGVAAVWGLGGASLHGLTVCRLAEDEVDILYSGPCLAMDTADLDRDGADEIVLAEVSDEPGGIRAIMLDYGAAGLRVSGAVPLSRGLDLQHVLTANIGFDRTAVLCEGYVEHLGFVTDVIVWAGRNTLRNLYCSDLTGVSDSTVREIPLWSTDANGDGTVELPLLRPVSNSETEAGSPLRLVDWCRCEENAPPEPLYTSCYHSVYGWNVRLPEAQDGSILPVQSVDTDSVYSVLFYLISGEGEELPLWELYTLSGETAEATEELCALRRLTVANGRIYAFAIYHTPSGSPYTDSSVPACFSLLPPAADPRS